MHLIVSHLIPFNINSLLSCGAPGTMRIFVFFLPCNREGEWMLGCVIKRRRPTTFRAVWASLDCETQFNGIKTELSKEFGLLASCLFWHRSFFRIHHTEGNSKATSWDFKHSTIKFYGFHTWKLLFSLTLLATAAIFCNFLAIVKLHAAPLSQIVSGVVWSEEQTQNQYW